MVVLINVEKIMLLQMTKKMVKPGQILLKSKIKMPKNVTTIKTVYNERQRYWRKQVDPRTEVQHLLKLIECDQYVY